MVHFFNINGLFLSSLILFASLVTQGAVTVIIPLTDIYTSE